MDSTCHPFITERINSSVELRTGYVAHRRMIKPAVQGLSRAYWRPTGRILSRGFSMKLHQLRYLAAVAQSGLNITAAAQKLHTSQPGVSKQIKLLEDELGFQIFVREGRNLTRITPAGQQVIDRALRILQEAQSIKDLS